eukprot:6206546-Pleurochrysis_carterae.AAC.4
MYPIWTVLPHLALLPSTQSVLSRYPSDVAIEADYLAVCPREPNITILTLARARPTVTCNCRRVRRSPQFETHMHSSPH